MLTNQLMTHSRLCAKDKDQVLGCVGREQDGHEPRSVFSSVRKVSREIRCSRSVLGADCRLDSFYTFYQGARRGLELYAPQPYADSGMLIASCLSLAPFVATAAIRPLTPYAVLLIGLDVWNSVMSPDEDKRK